MLIILPPSETKRSPPDHGRPISLGELSFAELTRTRWRILDALIATSAQPDAFERLLVRPSMAAEVARNTWLLHQPTRPAHEVYTGPLHEGFHASTLSEQGRARAERSVIVASALWGVLRPSDRIPSYRLHICARLIGMDRLAPTWRAVVSGVLADAAGPGGVIVDLRSPSYQAMGMPTGRSERTVILKVDQRSGGNGRIGDVVAKRILGEAAHHLLESSAEPDDPEALVEVLGERWPVRLDRGRQADRPSVLTISADD